MIFIKLLSTFSVDKSLIIITNFVNILGTIIVVISLFNVEE